MMPKNGFRNGLLVAVLAGLIGVAATRIAERVIPGAPRSMDSAPVATADAAVARGATAVAISHPEIGFHSRERLHEHFEKHGRDFPAADANEYLRLAQQLRDRPVGGDVLEIRRADGAVSRFDRASGAFLAFNSDLTIRTFFKPNDGESYFRRQAEREHR